MFRERTIHTSHVSAFTENVIVSHSFFLQSHRNDTDKTRVIFPVLSSSPQLSIARPPPLNIASKGKLSSACCCYRRTILRKRATQMQHSRVAARGQVCPVVILCQQNAVQTSAILRLAKCDFHARRTRRDRGTNLA